MSRVIKVEDQVYDGLDALRGKGETFSQVIEGFLGARDQLLQVLDVLEGNLKYKEWQESRLRSLQRLQEEARVGQT